VLEQFAYIISHNLRGPVATILAISDLMQDGNTSDDDKKVFMEGIAESVKKLDSVIIDLNTMIQSRSSDSENKEAVYFSNILLDIKSGIHGITGNELPTIKSDFSEINSMITLKSYIHSIFYNLISNSIKYKQPDIPVVIEIKSKKVKNKIELHFKDNGMGIDLDKKGDQVFGLYKRFHINAAEGKGMGLFMVKTQVETLGGKISVKSAVNVGTEFIIEFDL
jgi:signal transduction histidine kinase